MKETTPVVLLISICAAFLLGRSFPEARPGENGFQSDYPISSDRFGSRSSDRNSPAETTDRNENYPAFAASENSTLSDEDAIRIARDALVGIDSDNLAEAVVLASGRFKLVSFRIFRNPHDPRPHGPDTWHSPVWIDSETGVVVPPQMPDWKPMSDSDIKTFLMSWSSGLQSARNWEWSVDHVSGFARVRIRDTISPPPGPMVEDGEPAAYEYWIDETRKAEISAFEL